jgi:hypothetical protein
MKNENFLEKIPCRKDTINWTADENNIVTLEIENKGIFNKIAQILFKKPKISYVHLDEMGSYIWQLIDGKTNIIGLGERVKEHFGESAEPLYPRISKYFQILLSYGFVKMDSNYH